MLFIKSNVNRIWFYNWLNRDYIEFRETIMGFDFFEACRECVWLRSMSQHIQEASGIVNDKEPTKIFEDNSTCVAQLKESYN